MFGAQTRYDLREGFPLVTTKKVLFPAVVRELLWFLRGSTNINDDLSSTRRSGTRGPTRMASSVRSTATSGATGAGRASIRSQNAIDTIKKNPTSRRIIVSAWNVADTPEDEAAAVPRVLPVLRRTTGWLDCQLYQRSADLALGVPFNIASYALLMAMIAQECELEPRLFVHTLGDAHIYLNHVEGS